MITLVILGMAVALMTLPGTVELLALSLAGLLPARQRRRGNFGRLRIAVVIPAHNEELNIGRCVASLKSSDPGNADVRFVVIADNCSDGTAVVAASAGAQVLVRHNAELRGKGYALDHAFQTLLPDGDDAFIVVDADSEVAPDFLLSMSTVFAEGADAAQCRYIVRNSGESIRTRLMNVALYGFNVLRPRGRDRLGLSAGIYGNGFALSSQTLREVPYTASSVVEDLEYHLALVRAGKRVLFVDRTNVYGDMPTAGAGVKTQRARWEGGRLRMMTEKAPSLVLEILKGRFRFIEPCLDLLLLPLAFHVLLLVVASVMPYGPARWIGVAGFGVVALHLFAAIRVGSGTAKDVLVLLAAPLYVLWKILLIPSLLRTSRSGAAWVRTERAAKEKP